MTPRDKRENSAESEATPQATEGNPTENSSPILSLTGYSVIIYFVLQS
jgi:hypothetical protein